MSDINDLIHTNAVNAFEQGLKSERARIYRILKPLSKCDPDLCGEDGRLCYPDDCNAPVYRDVIQKILNLRLQEITSDSAEKVQKVIKVDNKLTESSLEDEKHQAFLDGMVATYEVVLDQLDKFQSGADYWHRLTDSDQAEVVYRSLYLLKDSLEDKYFARMDKAKDIHEYKLDSLCDDD